MYRDQVTLLNPLFTCQVHEPVKVAFAERIDHVETMFRVESMLRLEQTPILNPEMARERTRRTFRALFGCLMGKGEGGATKMAHIGH
jgi:hypothetical protein